MEPLSKQYCQPRSLNAEAIIAVLKCHRLNEYRFVTKRYLLDDTIFKILIHETIIKNVIEVKLECRADEESHCVMRYDYDTTKKKASWGGWSHCTDEL